MQCTEQEKAICLGETRARTPGEKKKEKKTQNSQFCHTGCVLWSEQGTTVYWTVLFSFVLGFKQVLWKEHASRHFFSALLVQHQSRNQQNLLLKGKKQSHILSEKQADLVHFSSGKALTNLLKENIWSRCWPKELTQSVLIRSIGMKITCYIKSQAAQSLKWSARQLQKVRYLDQYVLRRKQLHLETYVHGFSRTISLWARPSLPSAISLQSEKGYYYCLFLNKGGCGAWSSTYLDCQRKKPAYATATVDEYRAKQMGDKHEV